MRIDKKQKSKRKMIYHESMTQILYFQNKKNWYKNIFYSEKNQGKTMMRLSAAKEMWFLLV